MNVTATLDSMITLPISKFPEALDECIDLPHKMAQLVVGAFGDESYLEIKAGSTELVAEEMLVQSVGLAQETLATVSVHGISQPFAGYEGHP